MSWFTRRRNSKPSPMNLTKPLLKCLVTNFHEIIRKICNYMSRDIAIVSGIFLNIFLLQLNIYKKGANLPTTSTTLNVTFIPITFKLINSIFKIFSLGPGVVQLIHWFKKIINVLRSMIVPTYIMFSTYVSPLLCLIYSY